MRPGRLKEKYIFRQFMFYIFDMMKIDRPLTTPPLA